MTIRTALLVTSACASLLWTSTATADPIVETVHDVRTLDVSKPLPAGIKAKGKRLVAVHAWRTRDGGDGYLVLSTTDKAAKQTQSRQLFAQIYGGKKPREQRLIKDGVANCALDVTASFVTGSVTIQDVDADGIPEIALAYDIDCAASFDPGPRKMIVVEGARKDALRGRALGGDPDDKPLGGDYKVEGFKGQRPLQQWAEARWKALLAVAPVGVDP